MLITGSKRLIRPTWLRPHLTGGVVNDEGVAEVYRRAVGDLLTRPDLRSLLLEPPAMTNPGVGSFVLESLSRRPELAAGILSAHCTHLGVTFHRAVSRKIVTSDRCYFAAQASIAVGEVTVAGDERHGVDRASAADAAYVSLLARLAHLQQAPDAGGQLVDGLPSDRLSWRDAVWSPVSVSGRGSLVERLSMLDSNEFFGVLVAAATDGVAPQEVIEQAEVRARLGLLDGREVPLLLFGTLGQPWTRARLAVLNLLRSSAFDDHLVSRVLYDRFDELGMRADPVQYERVRVIGGQHSYEVEAHYRLDGTPQRVGPCSGADQWEARLEAHVRILAHLAGLSNGPLPSLGRLPIPRVPGLSAVQALQAAAAWGAITDLDADVASAGPPFVATVRCRADGGLVSATFAGPSPSAAAAEAGRILLMDLNLQALRATGAWTDEPLLAVPWSLRRDA